VHVAGFEVMDSERTRVRRLPELARYERDAIYAILDATTLCHVGVVLDGKALVLPTLFVRQGDTLLLHGSISSLLLRSAVALDEICVTVTLLDGLVVARSTFNSSVAYRSAVVFGSARRIDDPAERESALTALIEGILPGRSAEVRPSSASELRRTGVVAVTIEGASAKVNEGPPHDDDEDIAGSAWAGVVPFRLVVDPPIPAPDGAVGEGRIEVPASVRRLVGS